MAEYISRDGVWKITPEGLFRLVNESSVSKWIRIDWLSTFEEDLVKLLQEMTECTTLWKDF